MSAMHESDFAVPPLRKEHLLLPRDARSQCLRAVFHSIVILASTNQCHGFLCSAYNNSIVS